MEANFLRDYTCCGITLNSLHDLLQHYEENHAAPSNEILQRSSQAAQGGQGPIGRNTGAAPSSTQNFTQQQQWQTQRPDSGFSQASQPGITQQRQATAGFEQSQAQRMPSISDVDPLEDMDMDMDDGPTTPQPAPSYPSYQPQQQSQFGQPPTVSRVAPLNMNLANAVGHQGLRASTPTTPTAGQGFPQHNPTVSSVNTPALSTQPTSRMQSEDRTTPNTSYPGTPAELDQDFANNYMGGLLLPTGTQNLGLGMDAGMDLNNMNFNGMGNDMAGLTIDNPEKRLFSKQGFNQQQLAYALKNGTFAGDGELAKRIREQQLMQGSGGNPVGLPGSNFPNVTPFGLEQEIKPFRCPVIGCEKAYKNQNGLKYHKQVSRRAYLGDVVLFG